MTSIANILTLDSEVRVPYGTKSSNVCSMMLDGNRVICDKVTYSGDLKDYKYLIQSYAEQTGVYPCGDKCHCLLPLYDKPKINKVYEVKVKKVFNTISLSNYNVSDIEFEIVKVQEKI